MTMLGCGVKAHCHVGGFQPEVIWGSLLFRAADPCQSLDYRLPHAAGAQQRITASGLQHHNICMLLFSRGSAAAASDVRGRHEICTASTIWGLWTPHSILLPLGCRRELCNTLTARSNLIPNYS